MSMRWLPLVLAITACDPMPTRTLGELPGKKVHLGWSPDGLDSQEMSVYVGLDYELDECVAVDATATLGGKRLEVFERGSSGEDQHGGTYCARPGWSTVVPAGGDPASTIAIEIEDDTGAITYELPHPFAERTLRASTGGSTSVFPGDCFDAHEVGGELVLPPGQEVTLSWSPATDTVGGAVMFGRTATADPVFYLYDAHLTVTGSTIRFVAPDNAGQAAQATVEGGFSLPTLRCEGAEECSAGTQYCSRFTVRLP